MNSQNLFKKNKYELFIFLDFPQNYFENIDLSKIQIPHLFINENINPNFKINHPLINFFDKNKLNYKDLLNKIYKLIVYPDLNQVISHVLDDTNTSVLIFDQNLIIDFTNSTLSKQTGYKQNELFGKSIKILFSNEHSYMFYDNIFQTIKSNQKWSGNLKIKKKDNQCLGEKVIIKPLKKFGYHQYYIMILLNRHTLIKNIENHKREVKMAAAIQNSILSKPILTDKISIEGKYYPLNKISGDTYHWESLDENKYIVLLCDVVGHGIGSALVTTVISSIVRDLKSRWTTSREFLKELNNTIIELLSHNENSQDYYFTAMFLEINTFKKTIKYANCGHPPIYYFKDDSLNSLHTKNFPIGIFKDYEFNFKSINYEEPFELLLYTDGLKDLDMDYDSGLNILEKTLNKYEIESTNLLEFIEQEYLEHYYDKVRDDITLISIKLLEK